VDAVGMAVGAVTAVGGGGGLRGRRRSRRRRVRRRLGGRTATAGTGLASARAAAALWRSGTARAVGDGGVWACASASVCGREVAVGVRGFSGGPCGAVCCAGAG